MCFRESSCFLNIWAACKYLSKRMCLIYLKFTNLIENVLGWIRLCLQGTFAQEVNAACSSDYKFIRSRGTNIQSCVRLCLKWVSGSTRVTSWHLMIFFSFVHCWSLQKDALFTLYTTLFISAATRFSAVNVNACVCQGVAKVSLHSLHYA